MSGASATVTGRGPVTVLTLDRPPVNAMDLELLDAVTAQLQAVANARPAALVVAGRPGCFSAGVDLKAVPGYTAGEKRLVVAGINAMVIAAYALPCPVVAAITGHAIAGGFVLAMCADYRIASDEGRYGLTEVKVGVPYPAAAIDVVRAELEPSAARRLALGSQLTSAADCVALGAFDETAPAGAVAERALKVAGELAELPAEVYARTKDALRGRALAEMRTAAATDPLLDGWMTP
jgi:enoyl-CoA hydratase